MSAPPWPGTVRDRGVLETAPSVIKETGFGISHEELHFGLNILPDYVSPVVYLSLMNVAAGMLAGKGGLPFFAGGALAWWFIAPASVRMGWTPTEDQASFLYGNMLRPLGIGVLIGGALMGIGSRLGLG